MSLLEENQTVSKIFRTKHSKYFLGGRGKEFIGARFIPIPVPVPELTQEFAPMSAQTEIRDLISGRNLHGARFDDNFIEIQDTSIGVSQELKDLLWRINRDFLGNTNETEIHLLQRNKLKKNIGEIYTKTCKEDWDSEGAAAITVISRDTALLLIDLLPQNINKPEISPTPHGEIDFDWSNDRQEMLTVSICPNGSLAWSAQYEHFTCQGDAPWSQKLPCPLECCIQHFCED
ncbi:MAG: hypothetical protein OXC62_04425 [Aestuariivita sp.]|nr:hypothetical protein [Aestuariivita sp.]